MQLNVIANGSVETFNMMMYPEQNLVNQQHIEQQVMALGSRLGAAAGEMGQRFVASVQKAYHDAYNSDAVRAARAVLRAARGLHHPNSIIPLDSMELLQGAQPLMQRYLMADPMIRQMYFDQRIDGYSDSYRNIHGTAIGPEHYDFRRVASGVVLTPEEAHELYARKGPVPEDQPDFSVMQWCEDLVEGDRDPEFGEKADIINAWHLQRAMVLALQDSTSIYGGGVGA